jgi:hypothetical protein
MRQPILLGPTIVTVFWLALGTMSLSAQVGLPDDGASHPPPATGPYAYNSFIPGGGYTDPVFGTAVQRVTSDHRPDDIYSHKKVWNADGTRYLHLDQIINVATGLVEFTGIPLGMYSFDRGFDPVDPDVLYYQLNADLHQITLGSGTWTDSIYFTAPGGATLRPLGGEGDWLDASGRYMVIRYGPEPSVYLYDRQQTELGPFSNPIDGSLYIDIGYSIRITPDGRYLVGGGRSLPSPTHCAPGNGWGSDAGFSWRIDSDGHTVDAQPTEFWSLSGSHMDFVAASDGGDYAVVNDYWTPNVWLADITNNALHKCADQQHNMQNNKRLLRLGWNDARHITAVARGPLQDYAFVAAEDVTDTFNSGGDLGDGYISPWRVYKQEIIAINVLTGQILRVAHHRSRSVASNYAYQPRVSVSWGGEYVGWASNFNQPGIVDVFAVQFNIDPPGGKGPHGHRNNH